MTGPTISRWVASSATPRLVTTTSPIPTSVNSTTSRNSSTSTATNIDTGATTILSRNGIVDSGSGYTNNYYDARRAAGYLADQIEYGNWVIDFGGRYENMTGTVRKEDLALYVTDTTPGLSPNLANVLGERQVPERHGATQRLCGCRWRAVQAG